MADYLDILTIKNDRHGIIQLCVPPPSFKICWTACFLRCRQETEYTKGA